MSDDALAISKAAWRCPACGRGFADTDQVRALQSFNDRGQLVPTGEVYHIACLESPPEKPSEEPIQ